MLALASRTIAPFPSEILSKVFSTMRSRSGHWCFFFPKKSNDGIFEFEGLANFPWFSLVLFRYIYVDFSQRRRIVDGTRSRYDIFRERKRGRISLEVAQPGVIQAIREPIISLSRAEEGKLTGGNITYKPFASDS